MDVLNKGKKSTITSKEIDYLFNAIEKEEDIVFKTWEGIELEVRNKQIFITYDKKYYGVMEAVEHEDHMIFDIGGDKYIVFVIEKE